MGPGDDPELDALSALSTKMRRGRFMDQLPEEEREEIRIIISPGGHVEVHGASGDPESNDMPEEEAQEVATGEGQREDGDSEYPERFR